MTGLDWARLSRAERSAAYDNRAAVPAAATLIPAWTEDSAAFRAAHRGHLDQAYGPRPRNRLDLFPAADPAAPCLVFIHGGYWQRFGKDNFTTLIAGPLAMGWSCGMIGYTLCPEVTLTELAAEITLALDWLATHSPALGVTGPMVLSGWSAGGHLTALCLDHPRIAAGLAISGIFELGPLRDTNLNDALCLTDQEIVALSPMRLPLSDKPLAITYGTAELPPLVADSREFHALRCAAHKPGPLLPLAGGNHFSIMDGLARPDGPLTRQLPLLLS